MHTLLRLPHWRLMALAGVALLAQVAHADAQQPGNAARTNDPAFDRYVDLDLVAQAWQEKNADLLTDLGLQMAEGERVLQRPHRTVTAEQILTMAARIAAENKDTAALARLARALQGSKYAALASDISTAQKFASGSRAIDPATMVQADQVSPASFLIFQSSLAEIADAKIAENGAALEGLIKRIPDMKRLSDAQRRALLKAATEARAALPKEMDPSVSALNKLSAESRTNPPKSQSGGSSHPSSSSPHNTSTGHPTTSNNHPTTTHPTPPRPNPTNPPPPPRPNPPPAPRPNLTAPPRPNPPVTNPNPVLTRPVLNNPPRPNLTNPRPNTQNPNNGNYANYRKPGNTYVNNTVITNISNVNYVSTSNGFVIGGNTSFAFTKKWNLDPGEVIVSIGGMSCAGSNMSLQEMTRLAYQKGNLQVIIRDASTGNLETTDLDPPDGGGDVGNDGACNVVNTTWVGSENLGNYGRLEFRFQDNGQVTMIDTDGTQNGTYTVDGNNVTLSFYNGSVIYSGVCNGATIAGNARNANGNWDFSVGQ